MPNITVTPFLWFVDNADAAIERYLKVFDDTELVSAQRMPDGSLFLATIRLQGQELVLMNGGPAHSPARHSRCRSRSTRRRRSTGCRRS